MPLSLYFNNASIYLCMAYHISLPLPVFSVFLFWKANNFLSSLTLVIKLISVSPCLFCCFTLAPAFLATISRVFTVSSILLFCITICIPVFHYFLLFTVVYSCVLISFVAIKGIWLHMVLDPTIKFIKFNRSPLTLMQNHFFFLNLISRSHFHSLIFPIFTVQYSDHISSKNCRY